MSSFTAFAPAKINLLLAITGRRPDGFHNLVSLVVPLSFGDTLRFSPASGTLCPSASAGSFSLRCAQAEVPLDDSNLILKAARLYVERTGLPLAGEFDLEKRIPMGAGLGGGSSDASAALLLLQQAVQAALHEGGLPSAHTAPVGLGREALCSLAAEIGSDCPLFLTRSPIVMRGRGERVELLAPDIARRLSGRRVLLFKPAFGISTPWAYKQLAALAPASYLPEPEAEAILSTWLGNPDAPLEDLLVNNMQAPAFAKYLALPTLLETLRERFGLKPLMSGSGSCCFALLPEGLDVAPVITVIRSAWGASAFVEETRVA